MDEDKLNRISTQLERIELSIILWWTIGAGIALVKIINFLLVLLPPIK